MLQNVTPHKYVCAGRGGRGAAFGAGGRAAAPQLLTRARGGGLRRFWSGVRGPGTASERPGGVCAAAAAGPFGQTESDRCVGVVRGSALTLSSCLWGVSPTSVSVELPW